MPLQRYLEARFGNSRLEIVSDNARSPCHPLSQPCDYQVQRRHQHQAQPVRRHRSSSSSRRRASHPPSSDYRRFSPCTTPKPTISRWESAAATSHKDMQLLTPARRRNTLSTCTVLPDEARSQSPPEDLALKVPARRQSPPNLVTQLSSLAACVEQDESSYTHHNNNLNDSLTLLRLSKTESRDVKPRMPTKTPSGSSSSHSSQMRWLILNNIDRAIS